MRLVSFISNGISAYLCNQHPVHFAALKVFVRWLWVTYECCAYGHYGNEKIAILGLQTLTTRDFATPSE